MAESDITLDAQAIAALRALQAPGRPSILLRVMNLFETSATSLLAELEQGLEHGDLATVTRAAHTLKSSSANIGAVALADCSKAIEQCGRDGDLEGCRQGASGLPAVFMATLAAVAVVRSQETA